MTRHAGGTLLSRLWWFVLLWAASVLTLAAIALPLRWLMKSV